MANLEVQIGADSGEFMSEIAKVEKQLAALKSQQAANIKLGIDSSAINKQIAETTTKLNELKNSVNNSSTAFNNHAKSTANGGNTLMQFSRIAQDAPFGIMGIGNNLTATAEAFANLTKSSGGTGNALKAVASSMMGTGGILLAVSLVTTGLTYMSQNGITVGDVFNKLSGNFDEYAAALQKANLAAYNDDGVVKAVQDVAQLKDEVQLAKDGFISKQKVIEHYNETMGKTAGLVTTLDGVEQQLVKNGDAFIKMQLYKATATLAQSEAAKEMLNSEKISKQSSKDYTGVLEYMKGAFTAVASGQSLMSTGMFATVEGIKSQGNAFTDSKKKMEANLSVADKYNKMAAEISKQQGFNFFSDTKAPKAPKVPKQQVRTNPEITNNLKAADLVGLNDKEFQLAKDRIDRDGTLIKSYGKEGEFVKANLVASKQAISEEMISTLLLLDQFSKDAENLITNSIADTFGQLGDTIGNAIETGGNVLSAIGSVLLESLGKFLSEMGGLLIQYGTMAVIKGKLDLAIAAGGPISIAAGFAAIGVGIALKAIGSAIASKAKSSSSGSGGTQTQGNQTPQTGASVTSPTSSVSSSSGGGYGGGTVVFEISGQKLIGVLSNTLGANQRLGGSLVIGN